MRPQPEMLRLAARDGKAVPGRQEPGRGCWLCRDEKCAREAVKRAEIPRALKGKVAGPELASLLGWLGLPSLDGEGEGGLKS